MLSGTTATAVVVGFLTPKDGRVLVERTDPQTINNSMAITIQCVASVSNMRRCLHVRNHEVRALRSQVTILQRLLKDNKKKVRELKEENKLLKKLVDSYANDLVAQSIEQSKTTTKLQKQYEKLLVKVKELASRPILKKMQLPHFLIKSCLLMMSLFHLSCIDIHIHTYNWAYNLVFKIKLINIIAFPRELI